jgi:hypothetical protein
VALLISLATCLSTYFQARLYLPLYTLFQMGMLMVISLATEVIIKEVGSFKEPTDQRSSIIGRIRAKLAAHRTKKPMDDESRSK